MKIAITAKGTDMDAPVDPRFGRAAYILIVDMETMAFEVLDNVMNANAFKGAGIQAAGMVSDAGARALVTGYCGPNAFRMLDAAKIQVAVNASGSVREVVDAFRKGTLIIAENANADGHW